MLRNSRITAAARLLQKYTGHTPGAKRMACACVPPEAGDRAIVEKYSVTVLFFSAVSCDPANRSAFSSDCVNKIAGASS
jgi:hypothetical protein